MADDETIVIIGTGRAGTKAAETLRGEGFTGRVVLISDEREQPYDRVTLSKHYLYRTPGFHGLYFHDDAFYAERGIELQLGTPVTAIDPGRHDVVLSSGKRYRYEKLLLATGVAANRWDGRGGDLAGVHYVRTLADANRLRGDLEQASERGGSVVVVGAGWIGCEVAAAAWELGLPVSLIGRGSVPLEQQVGPQIGEFFRRAHASRGVDLHLGAEVAALGGAGSVENVVLSDGNLVEADVVVFGIGAAPRVELAEAAGLEVAGPEAGGGIVTDEFFATSTPGIFAAGDVANVPNAALGRRSRMEHYGAAFAQGVAAARSMLGKREPYSQIPFFFSDQFDIWMECTGDLAGADDVVLRTLPGTDRFIAFWLRDGMLAAGMNINIKGVPEEVKVLIAAGGPVDRAKLADPDVPLAEVLPGG